MKVAAIQSSFLPWPGYFDVIRSVDIFIFLDDVQYTKRDWRNRNIVKGPKGPEWLTVPVETKGKNSQKINQTQTLRNGWEKKILEKLRRNYARGEHFVEIMEILEKEISGTGGQTISVINQNLTARICDYLSIDTRLMPDFSLPVDMEPTERIANLVDSVGGTKYYSGPRAKNYLNDKIFASLGIGLAYVDYPPIYGPYPQLWGEFEPGLSIVDAMFNLGKGTSTIFGERL